MSDRETQIAAFLDQTCWADWQRKPIAGDASARRYMRLCQKADTVILMDADPDANLTTKPFARIAAILDQAGLCPPKVLSHNDTLGLMVITDLGQADFAKWLDQHPNDTRTLYQAAIDVLIHLQAISPPSDLAVLTPKLGGEMMAPLSPHYTDKSIESLSEAVSEAMANLLPPADTLALRDYHAENLIWRPHLTGTDRVGLLDFQDAFIAPAPYDLASLLRDVRRVVSVDLVTHMTQYYAEKTGSGDDLPAQMACLGAQRNLRILGIFARLAKVDNKQRYVDLIPRVWDSLRKDLDHPALHDLKNAARILPEPNPAHLAKLRT